MGPAKTIPFPRSLITRSFFNSKQPIERSVGVRAARFKRILFIADSLADQYAVASS